MAVWVWDNLCQDINLWTLTSQITASAFSSPVISLKNHLLLSVELDVTFCMSARASVQRKKIGHIHTYKHNDTHSGKQFSIPTTGRTTEYNIKEKEENINFHLVLTSACCAQADSQSTQLSVVPNLGHHLPAPHKHTNISVPYPPPRQHMRRKVVLLAVPQRGLKQ